MQVDLSQISGLPLSFDAETHKLIFHPPLKEVKPNIRTREEMKKVLCDPDAPAPDKFYYMYRDIHFEKDEELLRKYNVRYDITILPPFLAGSEFNKTAGHYHPEAVPGVSYPEVYEVLHGTAHYLLQKSFPPYNEVTDVILVTANAGDKVVIPPNYGHITINPSLTEMLVMSNYSGDGFSSIYAPYAEKRGGTDYEMRVRSTEVENETIVGNSRYSSHYELKFARANDAPFFGLSKYKPMYPSFFDAPDKFLFLVKPQEYLKEFGDVLEIQGAGSRGQGAGKEGKQ